MSGYRKQSIPIDEAKQIIGQYQFGLVYQLEKILLGTVEKIQSEIVWEECLEARFFSEEKELHIFDYNGTYRAVCVEDEEKSNEEKSSKYVLEGKQIKLSSQFHEQSGFDFYKVKKYISYDEDGQAVVELTRLTGLC